MIASLSIYTIKSYSDLPVLALKDPAVAAHIGLMPELEKSFKKGITGSSPKVELENEVVTAEVVDNE